MTPIDQVRDRAEALLHSHDRSARHVALGLMLTVGFALTATAVASRAIAPERRSTGAARHAAGAVNERPRGALGLILPAVFSATTLSALRVWNAPSRPERDRALGLWMLAQATNAAWLALRPASRGLQIAAAVTTAGMAAAFAHEARKLDPSAGSLASPTGAGVKLANRADRAVGRMSVH